MFAHDSQVNWCAPSPPAPWKSKSCHVCPKMLASIPCLRRPSSGSKPSLLTCERPPAPPPPRPPRMPASDFHGARGRRLQQRPGGSVGRGHLELRDVGGAHAVGSAPPDGVGGHRDFHRPGEQLCGCCHFVEHVLSVRGRPLISLSCSISLSLSLSLCVCVFSIAELEWHRLHLFWWTDGCFQ